MLRTLRQMAYILRLQDVARQFRLFPTKMGLWRLRAEVILVTNVTVKLRSWDIEVLAGLSSAQRAVAVAPSEIVANVPFDVFPGLEMT